jgi:hypothetical protein
MPVATHFRPGVLAAAGRSSANKAFFRQTLATLRSFNATYPHWEQAMSRILLTCLLLGTWSFVVAAEPQICPVCGRGVTPMEQMKDDVSKPSRNLAVWNRSSCGNPLFGPGSTICPHDWYAYSAFLKKWELSLEDPKGFALELDGRIRDLLLPEKGKIRSGVVYSQSLDGDSVVHSVLFWCETDQGYLDRLTEYAKKAGAKLKIERERLPGQTYALAEVETKRKPAAQNPTTRQQPGVPGLSKDATSLMKMVIPRVIIQDED